jgi:hypothetical protein
MAATLESYLATLSKSDSELMRTFRKVIVESDANITEGFGSVMACTNAIVFHEEGVFKYGIVKNKDYFSLHSMVLYSHPKLMENLKRELKKVHFQKGCINFKSMQDFPESVLREHMQQAAASDFSIVLNYYKQKNKS